MLWEKKEGKKKPAEKGGRKSISPNEFLVKREEKATSDVAQVEEKKKCLHDQTTCRGGSSSSSSLSLSLTSGKCKKKVVGPIPEKKKVRAKSKAIDDLRYKAIVI